MTGCGPFVGHVAGMAALACNSRVRAWKEGSFCSVHCLTGTHKVTIMTETILDASPADEALEMLVEALNSVSEKSEGMFFTLLVDGATVTGGVIPAWQWFTELAELVEAAGGIKTFSDWAAEEKRLNQEQQSSFDIPEAEWSDEQRFANEPPRYIHLRSASVVSGEKFIPQVGALMRIRLADVSGWTVGRLEQTRA